MNSEVSWLAAGVSTAGTSHIERGIPCQDFFSLPSVVNNRRVVALADGAGSAKCCETGAKIAVEAIIRAIASYTSNLSELTHDQSLEFGKQVRKELNLQSIADGNELGDYACTLLAAAFEDGCAYFWQVGDGAWIVETFHGIKCATWPCKGEFNNQTVFITSETWDSRWMQVKFAHQEVVAALGFTDGLEMFCLDNAAHEAHLTFVDKIFSALRNSPTESEISLKIEQMLNSPVIIEREDDDLTMVIVWKNTKNDPR